MTNQPRHETYLLTTDPDGGQLFACPFCGRKIVIRDGERTVLTPGEAGVIHFWTATIALEPEPVVVRK